MNKNKKVIMFLIPVTIFLIVLSGCSKFLDRKPLTATLADLNQGTLEAQSLGLYTQLVYNVGFSGLPWMDFNCIRDDDTQKGSSTTDGAEINTEFETFQYTKDDWATNTYWGDHYSMINACNKELYFADSLKLKDENSLRNVGEARFFRAYAFFELIKAYGSVPLINFYYTDAKAGIIPKSAPSAIYAQIDADLAIAVQNLPVSWATGTGANAYLGRLTRGAANTLWAQTQLFRGNWSQVSALCKQVIASGQYSLLSNYSSIWLDGIGGAGKNSSESIWECQASLGQNGQNDYGSWWGVSQNIRQGGAPAAWNLGWGWNVPTQVIQNAWDSTDPRKGMSILYSGRYDGGTQNGGWGATVPAYAPGAGLDQPYWNKKVYTGNDPAMRSYTGGVTSGYPDWIDHRILRYSDVLLMLAEASNELGDGATAAANLELVRKRASGGLAQSRTIVPYIPFTTQATMRTAIKNERRWEFAFEGYRFSDLVRWGDAQTALGSLGYQPKNALYPIPQPIITQFGGVLVQNPNY